MITSFDPHDESFDGDVFVALMVLLSSLHLLSLFLGDPFFFRLNRQDIHISGKTGRGPQRTP